MRSARVRRNRVRGRTQLSPFSVQLSQEIIEQFLAIVKIRALEARQCIGKIEEIALRRACKYSQGSGDLKSLLQRDSGTFAVVDQNEVGPPELSQA
jgi:hypothetical protein